MSATILPFPPDGEHAAQPHSDNIGENVAKDIVGDRGQKDQEDMGAARGAFAQLARRLHAAGMIEDGAAPYPQAQETAAAHDAPATGEAESVAVAPAIDETQFWPAGARAFL